MRDAARRRTLEAVVRSIDLTSLEGSDTPASIRRVCEMAVRPDESDERVPHVAAVCVYPRLVPVAVDALRGTGVRVAGVAGGFPLGLTPLDARALEIRAVVEAGAHEVDVVLNRSAFLEGREDIVREELEAERAAAGPAVMKVILETGELGSTASIRRAALLAMAAGADFVKTSTGKIPAGATLLAARTVADAVRVFVDRTGRAVGVKVAGGVRSAAAATEYLSAVRDALGDQWTTPDRFRIGASSLLADVVGELRSL